MASLQHQARSARPQQRASSGRGQPARQPEAGLAAAEGPEWSHLLDGAMGNSALVEAIAGRRLAEETAQVVVAQADTAGAGTAQSGTAGADADKAAPKPSRPEGTLGPVYDQHATRTVDLRQKLDAGLQQELKDFVAHYDKHKARYDKIGKEAGVPATLVAAIHWREASGDFSKYLHQGDPLGKPARRVPRNIPVFHEFDEAAVHALGMKDHIRDAVGLTAETRDPTAVATYAEAYNGLGYHYRDKASPYVYSGTEEYTGGKFVKDGVYSSKTRDKQVGVLAMMGAVGGLDGMKVDPEQTGKERTPDEAWQRMRKQGLTLKRGAQGGAVTRLQELLKAAGQKLTVDGDFGPGTQRALVAFQKATGLGPSGELDKATADALDKLRTPSPQGSKQA